MPVITDIKTFAALAVTAATAVCAALDFVLELG